MPKNIVVLSDGTGQEGGEGNNTNVYKLFNMIDDRSSRQVAFYDPGLGTGWHKFTGSVFGAGISTNILQCYEFIFEHFESGDQIFLMGFSRGAATVRSLSSFIHYFGILPKSRPELIERAYKIYKVEDTGERKTKAREFVDRHHNMWTRVKFIGCYDTVAALGSPFKAMNTLLNSIQGLQHKFHNFTLSESVENAYQALAIDDERKTFRPILWDAQTKDYQKIRQVWFAGMHTDVGGGYKEQNLSDIPLEWMTQKAVAHGLLLYPGNHVEIREDADGHMHDSRGSAITKLYRREARAWPSGRADKPVIHESVLRRKKDQANQENPPYRPWIVNLDYEVEPWVRHSP